MSFFNSMNTSASALTAQTLRMDVISENVANINTTRTEDGGPYKKKTVLFEAERNSKRFSDYFSDEMKLGSQPSGGVKVTRIATDNTEGNFVFNPQHPDANEEGYVEMPNVNIVEEMVNMISASRAYESNITAMNTTKAMVSKTLEIGR